MATDLVDGLKRVAAALADLKRLRGSGVDRDDIAWLEGLDGEG